MALATHTPVQGVRRHNRGVVLQTLLREQTASRADLARLTGLARPTITEVVRDLLTDGVVIETGQSHEARVGKPAVMLEVDGSTVRSIAVDLTDPEWIVGAVCGPDGDILLRQEVTRAGSADLPEAVAALVASLAARAGCPVLGIGIGVPMDAASGGSAAFIGALAAHPGTAGLSVHVVAEAELAARVEADFGTSEFLLVRLGETASTAIVTGSAASPTAHEVAHLDVGGDAGSACRCGNAGCVHAWLATRAKRVSAAQEAAERDRLRAEAGARIGAPLAAIVSALDLPHVVFSGPSPLVSEELCSAAESALAAARLPNAHVEVRLGATDDVVLRGAAAHVLVAELV